MEILTLIDVGVLANFQKIWTKISNINISTTTRTKEMNYSAFERSGIELSFWLREPLSPRAPFFRIKFLFPVGVAARGLVVTTGYYWGLLHQDLLWKGTWLVFLLIKDFWENWISPKTEFWKFISFVQKKTFFSALATSIFITLGPFKSI